MNAKNFFAALKRRKAELLSWTGASEVAEASRHSASRTNAPNTAARLLGCRVAPRIYKSRRRGVSAGGGSTVDQQTNSYPSPYTGSRVKAPFIYKEHEEEIPDRARSSQTQRADSESPELKSGKKHCRCDVHTHIRRLRSHL